MDRYDTESGQIYRETIVKYQPYRGWEHRTINKSPYVIISPHGADSLRAIVLRQIVRHATALLPATLENVPSHLVKEISSTIRRSGTESLHIWKVFAASGHYDKSFVHAAYETKFSKPIVDYFLDITSTHLSWLTDLTLADVNFSAIDLKQLVVLSNLRNLQVRHSRVGAPKHQAFDDAIISHLAWHAATNGALGRLQTIFVDNAQVITAVSLTHLSSFPSLDSFCVCGTSIRAKHGSFAKKYGWNGGPNTNFMTYVTQQRLRATYASELGNLASRKFWDLVNSYVHKRHSEANKEVCNLPILDAVFGKRQSQERLEDISEILCFERIWDHSNNGSSQGPSHQAQVLRCEAQVDHPAAKKRKLKDGKAIALETVLDAF